MIQRRLNVYIRERAHTLVRAGDLMVDPALHRGTSPSSLRDEIGKAFETIYLARLHTFKMKFGLKFLISALQSMAVFVLLFAGGIMVLNGKTEIGVVVAFISVLDRVLEPWREMIAIRAINFLCENPIRPDRGHTGYETMKLQRPGALQKLLTKGNPPVNA
jgi:ABC-type multidrug transport system fused ATPase/permease subunit